MKYLFLFLLLFAVGMLPAQTDTCAQLCFAMGPSLLDVYCRDCQLLPDSLPGRHIYKVEITARVDSLYTGEADLRKSLSYPHYITRARKANCPPARHEAAGYDRQGYMSWHSFYYGWFSSRWSTACLLHDDKGKTVSIVNRTTGGHSEYQYDEKGRLAMYTSFDSTFQFYDTMYFSYDSLQGERISARRYKALLGAGYDTEKTEYSADGSIAVKKNYSYCADEGYMRDSFFYRPDHKLLRHRSPDRHNDNIEEYQYDDKGRLAALIAYTTDQEKKDADRFIFHYRVDGLVFRIECYTSQQKESIFIDYYSE
jgi:hypothetical protein